MSIEALSCNSPEFAFAVQHVGWLSPRPESGAICSPAPRGWKGGTVRSCEGVTCACLLSTSAVHSSQALQATAARRGRNTSPKRLRQNSKGSSKAGPPHRSSLTAVGMIVMADYINNYKHMKHPMHPTIIQQSSNSHPTVIQLFKTIEQTASTECSRNASFWANFIHEPKVTGFAHSACARAPPAGHH